MKYKYDNILTVIIIIIYGLKNASMCCTGITSKRWLTSMPFHFFLYMVIVQPLYAGENQAPIALGDMPGAGNRGLYQQNVAAGFGHKGSKAFGSGWYQGDSADSPRLFHRLYPLPDKVLLNRLGIYLLH